MLNIQWTVSGQTGYRVVVFSCQGGGAHRSAVGALQSLMKGWNVGVVYPIEEVTLPGCPSASDVYNGLLQKGCFRWASCLGETGSMLGQPLAEFCLRGKIADLLGREHPDLVISVTPFVNDLLAEITTKQGLPFGIIPVDIGLRHWKKRKTPLPLDFRIFIAHDLALEKTHLASMGIDERQVCVSGFPLRDPFHRPIEKRVEDLRGDLGLPLDQKIVLLMGGGAGSQALVTYVRELSSLGGVHLVVICGNNQALATSLQEMKLQNGTVLGFVSNVDQYMAVADLLVTKPGPLSLEEARMRRLPVLVDGTTPLEWEKPNIRFVLDRGYGEEFTDPAELKGQVQRILASSQAKQKLQEDDPRYIFSQVFMDWADSMTLIRQQPSQQ